MKAATAFKLGVLALFTFIIAIPQLLILKFCKGPVIYVIPKLWHKIGCFLFKLKVVIEGRPAVGQVLFVGNHLSHFDIPVLGAHLKASFIAKEEVGTWPVMEYLSRLHPTAFISRRPREARNAKTAVAKLLDRGNSMILFAEGTSTRGETVLPFKSSMFSLALAGNTENLLIQPFTIELLEVNGQKPETKALRDLYAWDRDNDIHLGPHCRNFLETKGATIRIIFHDAVPASHWADRKTMAEELHKIVSAPLEMQHQGG